VLIGVDRDDIKSADAVRVLIPLGEKHGSRTYQLALLVNIYREPGARKFVVRAIPHLNEHEARSVSHNQVDFTKAGVEILINLGQAPT
jgi:hypothetical protein